MLLRAPGQMPFPPCFSDRFVNGIKLHQFAEIFTDLAFDLPFPEVSNDAE